MAKDAPKPASGEVTFVKKPAKVGEKTTKKSHRVTDMKFSVKGKEVPFHEEFDSEYTRETLAIDATSGLATKAKVTYAKHVKAQTTDGKAAPVDKVLDGKTFVIERKGTSIVVTDEAGKPVPAAEEKLVAKEHKSFGKADEATTALVAKPRKVGDDLSDVAKALALKMAGDDDGGNEVKDLKFSLKSIDATTSTFDTSFTAVGEKGDLTIKLAGTVKVQNDDVDLGEVNLSGPLTLTGKANATGTLTSTEVESH